MKQKIVKYLPPVLHAVALGFVFLNPAVQAYVSQHAASSGFLAVAWAQAMHLLNPYE